MILVITSLLVASLVFHAPVWIIACLFSLCVAVWTGAFIEAGKGR